MNQAVAQNDKLTEQARRELLAKVYALILADDWEDEALAETAEKPDTAVMLLPPIPQEQDMTSSKKFTIIARPVALSEQERAQRLAAAFAPLFQAAETDEKRPKNGSLETARRDDDKNAATDPA